MIFMFVKLNYINKISFYKNLVMFLQKIHYF